MAAVDVVVPVRDGGPLLQRAVDSVLAQEGVDVRVVVVDDGSTDGAPQRLAADPRLVVVANRGRGIPDALETGVAAGTADLVARQDADDESLPGRLREQVEHLARHPGIGLVSTHAEVVVADRVVGHLRPSLPGFERTNPVVAGSVVLRRELLQQVGGHRRVFALAEDYDLWLRLAAVSGVSVLPVLGYRYRLSGTQSTVR
ncbi:MAG: glycosyltransferase family 2 protein, partial [Mycobacteriales bacterium]